MKTKDCKNKFINNKTKKQTQQKSKKNKTIGIQ